MDEHGAQIHRLCCSVLRDEHLGADAAHETFVRLWKRLSDGKTPEHYAAWLQRVAVTTSLDFLRRQRGDEDLGEYEPLAQDDPSDEVAQQELERHFEAAVAGLPEGQRTVFLLRHSGGMGLAEIAAVLGVALPTVKTQFARACLRLQARLTHFQPKDAKS